ncbi:MAG: 2'-5' RNA ligase family protein [Thermomicrobiales bacterium]
MTDTPDTPSPNGRRVLVAVVSGSLGEAIQTWRQQHDPQQARRLPPHATLCYWAPPLEDADALDRQVRHAFATPVAVTLGGVHEFTNRDGTFFIEVQDTDALNAARARLFDGRFCPLDGQQDFTWHVTCVRYPEEAKRETLRDAARALTATIAQAPVWTVDTIAWLELRDGVYQPLRTWSLEPSPAEA